MAETYNLLSGDGMVVRISRAALEQSPYLATRIRADGLSQPISIPQLSQLVILYLRDFLSYQANGTFNTVQWKVYRQLKEYLMFDFDLKPIAMLNSIQYGAQLFELPDLVERVTQTLDRIDMFRKGICFAPDPLFPAVFSIFTDDLCTQCVHPELYMENFNVHGSFRCTIPDTDGTMYLLWSPFDCKLSAAVHNGIHILMEPGFHVLTLGTTTGYTQAHIANIVGFNDAPAVGNVYAQVSSDDGWNQNGLEWINQHGRIISFVEPLLRPANFRQHLGNINANHGIDVLYFELDRDYAHMTVARQIRIVRYCASHYLRQGGNVIMMTRTPNDADDPVQAILDGFQGRLVTNQIVDLKPYYNGTCIVATVP